MESPIAWLWDPLVAEEIEWVGDTFGTLFSCHGSSGSGFLWTWVPCSLAFLLLKMISGVPHVTVIGWVCRVCVLTLLNGSHSLVFGSRYLGMDLTDPSVELGLGGGAVAVGITSLWDLPGA